ncbi:hypothetical protein [Wolbachia endosymbiont (group A) of Myopa testacea]|uniref:hypothetical protein n=1 Tax=Wolbachia endosymbiont (group A) of Myopa testacea TaxID=3066148 RepID=UPI003132A71C
MWEKIKKFFKWIADRTGISWIARKISSGWKWLFGGKKSETRVTKQNTSQQGKFSNETLPKTLDNEAKPEQPHDELPVIGSICENTNGVLELFVTTNHTSKIFGDGVGLSGNIDLNYTESMDKLKYRVYIKCEKGGIFQITCNKLIDANNSEGAFLSIESVASHDGKTSSDELATMKQMLDLNEKQAIVAVTQISKNPITFPKVVANSNTPNSETTNSEAEQHTVGDDLSVNA